MFTLFRVATSEKWFMILADVSRQNSVNFICVNLSYYDDYNKYGLMDCGSPLAYPFFYIFFIIILLVLNLLVGIMINVSGNLKKYQERAINIYQLEDIVKLWEEFDIDGSGYMNYKDFWKFSSKIAINLGVKNDEFLDYKSKKLFLKILDLPVYEHQDHNQMFCFAFHDVVLALSKIAVIIKLNISKSNFIFKNLKFFFLFKSVDLDLPASYMSSAITMIKNTNKNEKIKRTKYTSEDMGKMMVFSPNIRHWKKKAQNNLEP